MAHYLEPENDGQQIVLDKAVILIGRGSDCDIVLTDSRKVSRKHCCIAQVNDGYVVRDLSSMNGVRINGKKVKRESQLEVGDELAFGDVRYVLRETTPANGSEPADDAVSPSPPPAAPPPVPGRPANISQRFPVPIDDEGVDFAVEASMQLDRSPLADVEFAEIDEGPADDSDDVVLEDSGETDRPPE